MKSVDEESEEGEESDRLIPGFCPQQKNLSLQFHHAHHSAAVAVYMDVELPVDLHIKINYLDPAVAGINKRLLIRVYPEEILELLFDGVFHNSTFILRQLHSHKT